MWKFYYDEAFHDRNITITKKSEEINIYKGDNSDIYTGFFCGYREEKENEILEKYNCFEEKYRKIYTIEEGNELKGTTIKRKNYKHGFASFADNTVKFYNDFFRIIADEEIVLQFNMFSKTEVIVREFIKNLMCPIKFDKDAFIYCLTKFLYNYRNQELLKKMMSAETKREIQEVLYSLIRFLKEVIKKCGEYKKKEKERHALRELVKILNKSVVFNAEKVNLEWRYKPIFVGFNKLLNEREIQQKEVKLLIDEENNTLEAAKLEGKYAECKNGKSHEHIGLRIVDILAHFLGELAVAFENALHEAEIKSKEDLDKFSYSKKVTLSPEWFKISEEQFLLWRDIEIMLYSYHLYEWTGYDGVFCDYPILVCALLEYIYKYETYEEYLKVKPELHSEYFNTYACSKLEGIYVRAGIEPQFDII